MALLVLDWNNPKSVLDKITPKGLETKRQKHLVVNPIEGSNHETIEAHCLEDFQFRWSNIKGIDLDFPSWQRYYPTI